MKKFILKCRRAGRENELLTEKRRLFMSQVHNTTLQMLSVSSPLEEATPRNRTLALRLAMR